MLFKSSDMREIKVRRVVSPLIVKDRRNLRPVVITVTIIALTVWTWFIYERGRASVIFHADAAALKITQLNEVNLELTAERDQVQAAIEPLKARAEKHRQAAYQAQTQVTALQNETANLRRQIDELRRLLDPIAGPITITPPVLIRRANNSVNYQMQISLTQPRIDEEPLEGELVLQVRGRLDGQERYLSLAELTQGERTAHRIRFRRFQLVEGRLTLPVGFIPDEILVMAIPHDRRIGGTQQLFKWVWSDELPTDEQ
ncbi:DUF6776 family protein [Thiospirillum jenense]|uniref:Uncharacterized protein n=1 Tax=Thiospirillum jenense TaxID=1653858 RepID=A0A839H4W3_9GAMM|nr:DUF6776 family protein [Thiospirillum jenense]MBB1125095.1 hypothetical protein [Thiospirillum jenense]